MKKISQGAEAIIYLQKDRIKKDRIKKSYRISILDHRLKTQRTKKEVKLLEKAYKIISVPKIISQYKDKDTSLEMEYIKGEKLSKNLNTLKNSLTICKEIGKNTAKLHNENIIHGDLTTSNMILKDKKVFFIDFGLGFESSHPEHKAVDLHVLKEALYARHFKNADKLWSSVLEGYKKQSLQSFLIINRLKKVEKRGRYKAQY